jgi:hypothetical protein
MMTLQANIYVAATTSAIVSNAIEASKTLWVQREIRASMFDLRLSFR